MKNIRFLAIVLVSISLFAACSKGANDVFLTEYERAFTILAEALESGDEAKIQAAENNLAESAGKLESVSGDLTMSQKLHMTEISVKSSAAIFEKYGEQLKKTMESPEFKEQAGKIGDALENLAIEAQKAEK